MLWAGSQCKNKKAQKVFLKGSLYFTLPLGMLLMEVPLWICFGTLCMTGMVLVRLHISTEEREKPAVHLLWWT